MVAHLDVERVFSLDLETSGLNPIDSRILLCQIGFPDTQYVVEVATTDISPILPYLKSRNWKKLIFNAKFEDKFFQYFYQTPILNVFDCFLAERVLNPDKKFGNSFEDLAQEYLDVKLDKKVRTSFLGKKPGTAFTEKQIQYAAEDVRYLFPLWEKQRDKLEEKNLTHIAELEFEVATIVASMELAGVPVDTNKWKGMIKLYDEKLNGSKMRMFEIMFDENDILDEQMGMFERDAINLRSQPQLLKALNKLGLDIENTNERTISLVDHPVAHELLEYRGIQKVIDAYGFSVLEKIHPFTGRIHADWFQMGTETGRFSCREPNLQQIPPEFRECFVADGDYVFIGADYSQIELRILAFLSKDPTLSAAFKSGLDVHTATAASMFHIALEDVTKEQRFAAKTLNFGLSYGMGIKKLKDNLNVEARKNGKPEYNIRQVQDIHSRYKRTYQTATRWLESTGERSFRDGYSQTLYGRKRFFNRPQSNIDREEYDRQVAGIKRQGANTPIQGTNADITKLAMVRLHNELKDYNFRANIILQVHDEIVVLAHKSQIDPVKQVIEESMVNAAKQILTTIPVKVDTYVSSVWKK